MQTVLSIAVDALAYGMVLFVISIGLSVTMGLMRVVNLAHGAFAMIGGYFASYAVQQLGLNYGFAIIIAVVGTMLIAVPVERLLYRRIYGAPELTQVLMTIGITFCIIGLTNYIFGPTLKTIPLPEMLRGSVDLGFRAIAKHRIFAIGCGFAVAFGLWYIIERTAFGVKLRAAVDNANMAAARGCTNGNRLCRQLCACHWARSVRRCCRRRTSTCRTLLCTPLHGDISGCCLCRRRRLHTER